MNGRQCILAVDASNPHQVFGPGHFYGEDRTLTQVIQRRRPLSSVQLAKPEEALRFRLGDRIEVVSAPSWWARALRWVARVVFRRPTPTPVMLEAVAVDHKTGVVTLETRT
jgi:hypothetical protein